MLEQTETLHRQDGDEPSGERHACTGPMSFWMPDHIMMSAWLEHAPFAFWVMNAVRPRVLVELGTHLGFSFLAFCQAVQRLRLPTHCYAVDTWVGDDHAGFYGDEVYRNLAAIQSQHYGGFSTLIRSRFDEALPHFGDGTVDLLHIDGRHGYDDVVEDYATWLPKLSAHGVVLFHDTTVRERQFGVWRLWSELRDRHPSFEFTHGHGLGVLCPGGAVPPGLQPLFDSDDAVQVSIREVYSRLGTAVSLQYGRSVLEQQLGEARARIGALEGELGRHVQHETQLETGMAAINSDVATTHEEVEALRASLSRAEGDLNFAREELSVAQADLADARRDLSSVRSEASAAQQKLAHTSNELAQITSSSIWRATGVARSVGSRLPQPVRTNLRRGLKLLWWAATPHRMPARIRLLKARAAQNALLNASRSDRARAFIGYQPQKQRSTPAPVHGPEGTYRLGAEQAGYVYIPRRRPDDLEQTISTLSQRPSFSLVVPLYNTPDDLFRRMVGSVLAQWYPHWELILVDDKSPNQSVRDHAAAIDDPRVRTLFLDTNEGISGATNRGIELASGEYIVFLDHDDELTDDCLFELALCINAENPDFVYSDEDKIMPDGSFGQPFFKPDWSPDAMMSTMYTCHVSCVRRALLDSVGYLRSEYDGSQDWDFILRVTEQARRIAHIPKVLYHWRVIPQSVASDLSAKPYAVDAGKRARESALKRRGLAGKVEPLAQLPGYYRVKYDVQGSPLVSIIIPSKNNGVVLKRCIDSIFERSLYRQFEIVLLDNGSSEPDTLAYLDSLRQKEQIRIVRHDAPFNYSEINNIGVRAAEGSILLFLNDDTEVVAPDWMDRMAGYAQLNHVGAVGAKLLYPDSRRIQHNGVLNLSDGPNHAFLLADANDPGYFVRNLLEYDWIAVTGACLMVERAKFEAAGGFDEAFPLAYNDVDLCFRLVEAGLYNVVCPAAELLHYESMSRGLDSASEEKRNRLAHEKMNLYQKHPRFFMHDPFYSPNLAPNDLYFSLA